MSETRAGRKQYVLEDSRDTRIANVLPHYLPHRSQSTKLMVALNPKIYEQLRIEAEIRGVTIQELIRAVVIPEWSHKSTHSRERSVASEC